MSEFQDTIKYKVVVDPSDTNRAVQRATDDANRRQKAQSRPGASNVPSTPRDLPPGHGDIDGILRRYIPAITNVGQIAVGARGTWLDAQRAIGATFGMNPVGIMRGSIGAAGGLGHVMSGGVGLGIGGVGGAAVGAGLGLVVSGLTKSLTGLVDITEKMSSTFSRFNGAIATSQAMYNVATIQNNIRLAQATEPVIVAFNKLKISVLDTAGGIVAGLANRFGSSIGGAFSSIDDWIKRVAGHFGINLGSGPSALTAGALAKSFQKAGGGVATGGEIYRSMIGGSIFGGDSTGRQQQDLANRLLKQREHVRAIQAQAAGTLGGSLSPSQSAYVDREQSKLDSLQSQYNKMRSRMGKRFAGRGAPLGGTPPGVRMQEGDIPPLSTSDRISALESRIASNIAALNKSTDDPFWRDPANNRPVDWQGIQAKRESISRQLNNDRLELAKLKQHGFHPAGNTSPLANQERNLMKIIAAKSLAQRDLDKLESINPARRSMDTIEKINGLHDKIRDLNRSERNQNAQVEYLRKHQHASNQTIAPFAAMDIRQTVNLKLDMKLASEKDVHEAMADVRKMLNSGLNQARNETRLAMAAQNLDRSAVL